MVFDVSVAMTWILFLALFPMAFFWLRRAWRILVKRDFSEVALKRGESPPDPARWAPYAMAINLSPASVVVVVIVGVPLGSWNTLVTLTSFAYLLLVAVRGGCWPGPTAVRAPARALGDRQRLGLLALSPMAVYCTAWTYFGSVGRAASGGVWFLPIYLGPTLAMVLAWMVLRKMIRIARTYRITSIADFIASRYGKSPLLAGLVTLIAVVGIVPYIALQLKAIASGYAC
jgi:hypothetical protein